MRFIFIPLILFSIITSCQKKILDNPNVVIPQENKMVLLEEIEKQKILNNEDQKHIDSLFIQLLNSKYELCNCHHLTANHDTSNHNTFLDFLYYYYNKSYSLEKYIYAKLERNRGKNMNERRWINCLKMLKKNDCNYNHHSRLDVIPIILKDTFSIESSTSITDKLLDILDENCFRTINYIRHNSEWRKKVFKGLIVQLTAFEGQDDYLDENIYEIMSLIPDSLTTNYAFNFFMEKDTIPYGINDIIDFRFKDLYFYEEAVTGKGILFSEKQVRQMIERTKKINSLGPCKWCEEFVTRMNLRFKK